MTEDFEILKNDLERLYKELSGKARFAPLEGQLKIEIIGDGLGHFIVHCTAQDQAGFGNVLRFELTFDQTVIPGFLEQLNKITKAYPTLNEL